MTPLRQEALCGFPRGAYARRAMHPARADRTRLPWRLLHCNGARHQTLDTQNTLPCVCMVRYTYFAYFCHMATGLLPRRHRQGFLGQLLQLGTVQVHAAVRAGGGSAPGVAAASVAPARMGSLQLLAARRERYMARYRVSSGGRGKQADT